MIRVLWFMLEGERSKGKMIVCFVGMLDCVEFGIVVEGDVTFMVLGWCF